MYLSEVPAGSRGLTFPLHPTQRQNTESLFLQLLLLCLCLDTLGFSLHHREKILKIPLTSSLREMPCAWVNYMAIEVWEGSEFLLSVRQGCTLNL